MSAKRNGSDSSTTDSLTTVLGAAKEYLKVKLIHDEQKLLSSRRTRVLAAK